MDDRNGRALQTLRAASVTGGLAQSLAGAAGALLARQVGGSEAVAGLPQALLVAGSAVAALALSALTQRRGRGTALSAGAVAGALGSLIVLAGAVRSSLPPVLGSPCRSRRNGCYDSGVADALSRNEGRMRREEAVAEAGGGLLLLQE